MTVKSDNPALSPDTLVCGSVENGGLTRAEVAAFDRELAVLREHPKALPKPLWEPHSISSAVRVCWVPWRQYPLAQISWVPFNGCSATVVQDFAMLHREIDKISSKHVYDIPRIPKLVNVDLEKFREYVLYRLFSANAIGTPLFLNLPPPGREYASARRFLAKHKAEIACEFVNPNYPERADTKEYTTLYVFDHIKWLNLTTRPQFKGLIK